MRKTSEYETSPTHSQTNTHNNNNILYNVSDEKTLRICNSILKFFKLHIDEIQCILMSYHSISTTQITQSDAFGPFGAKPGKMFSRTTISNLLSHLFNNGLFKIWISSLLMKLFLINRTKYLLNGTFWKSVWIEIVYQI